MIYKADYSSILAKINHLSIIKYLKDMGWTEFPTKRQNVKVYQQDSANGFNQINIPIDKHLSDYIESMLIAIETIAIASNKTLEQIILELLNPLSDVLRIRISSKDTTEGSLFLEDAINLYDNSRKLISAAAMDLINPKIIHRGRPDYKVQEFVNSCKFGQTEIGSYIVSIICPLGTIDHGQYEQLSIFTTEDESSNSFTRKVVNKILRSIRTTKEQIDAGNIDDIINGQNSEDSISVNFLEALDNMCLYKEDSQLNITAKWAPSVTRNTLDYNSVFISGEYNDPIQEAVRRIKKTETDTRSYVGRIRRIESSPEIRSRQEGKITIVYLTDKDKPSTATAILTKEDHDRAIHAYENGLLVRVTGNMVGQTHKIIEGCSFEII